MKWDCGETRAERYERLSEWHRWFAWYPVRVGSHDCRWLEYVERRASLDWAARVIYWHHRPLSKP